MNHQYEDLLIDALLDEGFTLEEAMNLIALQEQLDRDNRERRHRQREEHTRRLWLGDDASPYWLN
ncbi:MAG: hypothetical protein ABI068_01975 [Ktedonobacterales bacterium]